MESLHCTFNMPALPEICKLKALLEFDSSDLNSSNFEPKGTFELKFRFLKSLRRSVFTSLVLSKKQQI